MAIYHGKSQQPNNQPLPQTRRSVLKKMLVGTSVAAGAAVLPEKWVKPVVDKILVPAHAQTSCGYPGYRVPITITAPNITSDPSGYWDGLNDLIFKYDNSNHSGEVYVHIELEFCNGTKLDGIWKILGTGDQEVISKDEHKYLMTILIEPHVP